VTVTDVRSIATSFAAETIASVLVVLALCMPGPTGTALAATPVRSPSASSPAQAPPSKPNAPLQGEITSVDAAQGAISIDRKSFRIGAPMLALLDQRPNATGLLDVDSLRPGMKVRYRTVAEGGTTRVVELWVLHDAAKDAQ
jgi:hypothetical protein